MIVFTNTRNPNIHPDVQQFNNVYHISISEGMNKTIINIDSIGRKKDTIIINNDELENIYIKKE